MTMLTPNELRNVTFGKSAVGGYKVSDVDEFLDRLTAEYDKLYNENIELMKKMEVLAGKIEEYKGNEDNINAALLSAQKTGDSILRECKHKADLMWQDANIKAEKVMSEASSKAEKLVKDTEQQILRENTELARIKVEVSNFKDRLLNIYKEHLRLIDALPSEQKKEEEPAPEAVEAEVPVEEQPAPQPEAGPAAPVEGDDVIVEDVTVSAPAPEQTEEKPLEDKEFVLHFHEDQEPPEEEDLKFGENYNVLGGDEEDGEPRRGFFGRKHK